MSICTFFGHRECPELSKERLYIEIEKLISQGVYTFYVGNNGQFDAHVRRILRQLQSVYPFIKYAVVLAYLPTETSANENYTDTLYPEGMEEGPPRFAIERRNKWMLNEADYVICYVRYAWGGAYKFSSLAKRRGKNVINLCDAGIPL